MLPLVANLLCMNFLHLLDVKSYKYSKFLLEISMPIYKISFNKIILFINQGSKNRALLTRLV